MYVLESIEKETIINYNNAEKEASIYTCNENMQEKIRKLAEKYPEQVKITASDNYSVTAEIPKKWVKIVPPRNLTDEQRAAAAERMKKVRYKRGDMD